MVVEFLVASSAVTARFFTAGSGDVFNTAPAQQPAFTEVLPGIALNPPSNPFTAGPAIDGSQSPVLALFGDAFETYIGNAPIAGGSFTTLGGWSGTRWSAVFTGHLIVKTPGQYSLVVDQEGVMVLVLLVPRSAVKRRYPNHSPFSVPLTSCP